MCGHASRLLLCRVSDIVNLPIDIGCVWMKVAFVTKPDKQMTGLLRYAQSVHQVLRSRGVDAMWVHPRPPLPGVLARMGRAVRLDVAAFFASYPVSVQLGGASLCHLTSQTLATLLVFQRLPRTVVTVHDIIPYLTRQDPVLNTYRNGFERFFDWVAMRALQQADAIIAISEFTKRCVVDALHIPAERVRVIHRAVNREALRPLEVPAGFRRAYGLEEGERCVLYVGSEDPRKNVAKLIEAFAIARVWFPAARLIKVGAPHLQGERQKLLRLVAELGLQDKVRFLNHVAEHELPLLYNVADVLVLPSLHEGFGLPALEAMSCGTPVIASNRSSLPEVVGDGGILVDPLDERALAERMVEILADPDRRSAASRAALQRAEAFSLEQQASETMRVYREVMTEAS